MTALVGCLSGTGLGSEKSPNPSPLATRESAGQQKAGKSWWPGQKNEFHAKTIWPAGFDQAWKLLHGSHFQGSARLSEQLITMLN